MLIMLNKLFLTVVFVFSLTATSHSKCPDRIVSLTLASDEILLDIVDEKERISAITYLASDKSISNVADRASSFPEIYPNLEQVINLSPDIVIVASYINQNFRKQLDDSGIKTLFLKEFGGLSSVKENINLIGKAVCEEENAKDLIKNMELKLSSITKKIPENKVSPKVLYYSPSGFTAGKDSTVGEIIEMSGAINLGSKTGIKDFGKISLEYIIDSDPDIIILSSFNPSNPDFPKEFIANTVLKNISAVKNSRVKVLPGKHIISASHYVVNSVDDMVNLLLESYWNNELQK